MGEYFLMSTRFNKRTCTDFGLIPGDDDDIAIHPKDHSLWKKCCLYDLGWGKENGFYKLPLPGFGPLMKIVLHTSCDEDRYGAASVILDMYPEQLLEECERLIFSSYDLKRLKEFIRVFQLTDPINRSPTQGKSIAEIAKDYERWKAIAEYMKRVKIF